MLKKKKNDSSKGQTFQEIIMSLQKFWGKYGCVLLQPYDLEVGAGTFHPATTLRSLGPNPWKAAYVQPSRRPTDGRYGENPNRLQHYYQFQVIIKPSPKNIKNMEKPKGFIARKLSSSIQSPIDSLTNTLEEKSMWQKFGL